ncbi:hypothetical protein SRB5_12870 [Streptomyces sp. RB5]|uniref:PucR C-terminal helix-turn-helix domain-containing protein n=1 Tax=Streptomyces smaragdinus TaxID=2585196 RepID=A0A7K0CCU6_9ACTN|nr:helix-turn-helix domain-containing protein [Streptomyces smaragdinus]MQY11173.1 hypothetical protein [Streptomyces smaragdinus]
MKGLLLRLSALDAEAGTALRVIAHYEGLLSAGPLEPQALVRSTAGLAECPAGWEPAEGPVVRFGPEGDPLPGAGPLAVSGEAALEPAGRVWLERPGGAGPLDELILEWMAIAAQVTDTGPDRTGQLHAADPALAELVLSEREEVADRARALRLLGLVPERPLRVLAVAAVAPSGGPPDPGVAAVTLLGRTGLTGAVRVVRLGELGAVLVQRPDGDGSPAGELRTAVLGRGGTLAGIRVGVGGSVPALEADRSWREARAALRFAGPYPPGTAVADHDELGVVSLLADIPAERLRARPEVGALAELADRDGGAQCLEALAAFCGTGSLRQAAAVLHLHHSSVAARLHRVESALGWHLQNPHDRFRAQLALHAYRAAGPPA